MPTLEFETIVPAPMAKVWAFFENVETSLPALFDPNDEVTLERADVPIREGSLVIVQSRTPIGMIRMAARVIEHRPPHAVVFGEEARFVDVQESGPFKSWRHEHDFERIDEKTTRVLDRVTYRVPFGPIGWIADFLLVRRRVRAMFRFRREVLRKLIA
jgi:ligand-binding SRPBCC domain-containing protein